VFPWVFLCKAFAQDKVASIGFATSDHAFAQESDLTTSSLGASNGNSVSNGNSFSSRSETDEATKDRELENIRLSIQSDLSAIESQERRQTAVISKTRRFESDLSAMLAESEFLEKDVVLKRKTLEMLPSASENIGKLQSICAASAKRLMQLAQEWETHRRQLMNDLRLRKSYKTQRKNKCKKMVDDMKRFREEMQDMIVDLKDKQDRTQVLNEELSKLPRNINRNLVCQFLILIKIINLVV